MKTALRHITLYACALLVGCAAQFNPVGEVKFDCNRKQDAQSPYCRSFKSVEQSTTGQLPRSRFDREFNIEEHDRLTGIAPDAPQQNSTKGKAGTPAPPAAPEMVRLPHQMREEPPLEGQPVRQGPVVQRVWIKRFVDGRDVLTENTVVYKEIQPNRWAGFEPTAKFDGDKTAYPRRPIEAPKDEQAATPSTPQNQEVSKASPQTEFKQPGIPERAESASEPAASGSSMPN